MLNKQPQGVQPENEMAAALVNFEKPRITERDCEVLRVFVEAPELLTAMKNIFYGIETEAERETVRSRVSGDETQKVLKKFFIPEVSPEDPVGQSFDLYKTKDFANATPTDFDLVWESKNLLLDLLETGFTRLFGNSEKLIDLTPKKDLAFMTARNNYIDFVANSIRDIVMNANRKAETVEQMLERKRKNSSK